jgi:ankyrin repeat protein
MGGETFLLDVHNNNLENVKVYILRKGDINYQIQRTNYALEYYEGETSLIIATKNNNVEIVKLLLRFKCSINNMNCNGETSMHIACKEDNVDVVKELILYGADNSIVDKYGEFSLNYLTDDSRSEIEEFYDKNSWFSRRKELLLLLAENNLMPLTTTITEIKYEKILRNEDLVSKMLSYL